MIRRRKGAGSSPGRDGSESCSSWRRSLGFSASAGDVIPGSMTPSSPSRRPLLFSSSASAGERILNWDTAKPALGHSPALRRRFGDRRGLTSTQLDQWIGKQLTCLKESALPSPFDHHPDHLPDGDHVNGHRHHDVPIMASSPRPSASTLRTDDRRRPSCAFMLPVATRPTRCVRLRHIRIERHGAGRFLAEPDLCRGDFAPSISTCRRCGNPSLSPLK